MASSKDNFKVQNGILLTSINVIDRGNKLSVDNGFNSIAVATKSCNIQIANGSFRGAIGQSTNSISCRRAFIYGLMCIIGASYKRHNYDRTHSLINIVNY